VQAGRNFFLSAVIIYGLSALYSVFLWRKGFRHDDRVNYFFLLLGAVCHTLAMFKRGLSFERCPVNNLYEVLVFISWTIVASCLVVGAWPRLRFLSAFASPILLGIGVFALMPALDNPYGARPEFRTDWPSIHAALILLSCGAFGLGSVAGLMYLTQEHDLKFHKARAILSLMPPIQRLERIMGTLLLVGFILLTAGLSLSPLLLKQRYGVYFKNDPILLYSIWIWMVYLSMLLLRWRYGQGGRRFAWGAVGSFAFILLTFWGFILLSPVHTP
jgi:ABC-type uncharacterized transport system permease subunit